MTPETPEQKQLHRLRQGLGARIRAKTLTERDLQVLDILRIQDYGGYKKQ